MLATFARSCKIKVGGGSRFEVSEKQNKSNDQRVLVTRYEVLLSAWPGRLSSLIEPYDNY